MPYDLILLDLTLPDGRGLDFLQSRRADGDATPVIILTARDQITDRIAALNAGADDYLVKPFDLAELIARLNAVARRYSGNPNPLVEVAEPLAHRREATLEAIAAMLLPLAMLAPLSLIGIWVYVTRSLRPILRLRSDIATRGGADLSPVENQGLPNEIEAIGASVNQLLARLRRTLEAERSFTSNSTHELRTPIAATLAQAQRLIAEVPEGPLRDRACRIEADLLRLPRLSEKLMQLARAEGGEIVSAAPQDLAPPVLALVVEDFHRSGDGAGLRLRVPADGAAPSAMDVDAFAILARNLIENALHHGDPGSPIEVEMTAAGALRVVNGGAIVPPDRLAHLKTRFARGTSPAEGSGLGPAIAEAIVVHAGRPSACTRRRPAAAIASRLWWNHPRQHHDGCGANDQAGADHNRRHGPGHGAWPARNGSRRLGVPGLGSRYLPVLAALLAEIVTSLRRGDYGLDVVAAVSMSAALAFGETLAAAVVALMYAGGQYL